MAPLVPMILSMHRGAAPDIFFLIQFKAWLVVFAVGALALVYVRDRITIWPAVVFTFAAPIVWWLLATSDYRAWYDGGDSNAAIAVLGVFAGWLAGAVGAFVGAVIHRLGNVSGVQAPNQRGSGRAS